ncbi:MAG TPA: hypothetical protein VN678_11935 [Acidobacteriaceae bacterium]|nr:hypothetical protein [Acidobacteriaceae bacterium]
MNRLPGLPWLCIGVLAGMLQPAAAQNSPLPRTSSVAVASRKTPLAAATLEAATIKGAEVDPDDDTSSKHDPIRPDEIHHPILWHDPGAIASLDLLHGQGGSAGEPQPPFTFLGEDHDESSPKFDVRDAHGRKWRGKFGLEVNAEIAVSRLLWAVGYFVEDDYYLATATVPSIHMSRGKKYVHGDQLTAARFARRPDGEKKIAIWKWKSNPFLGTREFNGLRVMIALVNSWDLKDDNNSVYSDKKNDRQLFLVSDTGSSFGRTGLHFVNSLSKNNLPAYEKSKFITHTTTDSVDFAAPAPSLSLLLETLGFGIKQYIRRENMLWIGRHIPRQDARWIGSLLGQLSHRQIEDAFRAGGYSPDEVDGFTRVIEGRIRQLNAL